MRQDSRSVPGPGPKYSDLSIVHGSKSLRAVIPGLIETKIRLMPGLAEE